MRLEDRLDKLTTTGLSGYVVMVAVMVSIFVGVFVVGNFLSAIVEEFLLNLEHEVRPLMGYGAMSELIWAGIEGLFAGIALAIPYVMPFYFLLGILEDSGYLARMAFMMDNLMHFLGLHGKAFIPLILSYGCNVPRCLSCRILETERDKIIAAFVTTLVPCAARTVIILGLVGRFVGIEWALAIYALDIVVILTLGRLAYKALPGESMGLIIEMPPYRMPHVKTVVQHTWYQVRSFLFYAFPFIVFGSVILSSIQILGLLEPLAEALSPITAGWLGLPSITGALLIFGVLRKELTLLMLATLTGTRDFASILTGNQMIVFAVVTMFYVPCVATIATLWKELGARRALFIVAFEIVFAIFLGGIVARLPS